MKKRMTRNEVKILNIKRDPRALSGVLDYFCIDKTLFPTVIYEQIKNAKTWY
jgi:hypothetical protein